MPRPYWVPLVAALSGCAVTPSPIDDASLMGLTQTHLAVMSHTNEPIAGALSVYDALARALKYNLDAQVETVQAALRGDEIRLASAQMPARRPMPDRAVIYNRRTRPENRARRRWRCRASAAQWLTTHPRTHRCS